MLYRFGSVRVSLRLHIQSAGLGTPTRLPSRARTNGWMPQSTSLPNTAHVGTAVPLTITDLWGASARDVLDSLVLFIWASLRLSLTILALAAYSV